MTPRISYKTRFIIIAVTLSVFCLPFISYAATSRIATTSTSTIKATSTKMVVSAGVPTPPAYNYYPPLDPLTPTSTYILSLLAIGVGALGGWFIISEPRNRSRWRRRSRVLLDN